MAPTLRANSWGGMLGSLSEFKNSGSSKTPTIGPFKADIHNIFAVINVDVSGDCLEND
jgi:hypothetical protein